MYVSGYIVHIHLRLWHPFFFFFVVVFFFVFVFFFVCVSICECVHADLCKHTENGSQYVT